MHVQINEYVAAAPEVWKINEDFLQVFWLTSFLWKTVQSFQPIEIAS